MSELRPFRYLCDNADIVLRSKTRGRILYYHRRDLVLYSLNLNQPQYSYEVGFANETDLENDVVSNLDKADLDLELVKGEFFFVAKCEGCGTWRNLEVMTPQVIGFEGQYITEYWCPEDLSYSCEKERADFYDVPKVRFRDRKEGS